MSEKRLNPDINKVDIGVRELTTITIYPLSAHDQFDLTSRLVNTITTLAENDQFKDMSNEQALEFIQTAIKENLDIVLEYAVDEPERPTMKDLTNNQIYNIVAIIFEVNYEGFIKNFKDLFERGKTLILGAQKM